MSYRLVADLSHSQRIEDFPDFELGESDYIVEYIEKSEGPLTFEQIDDYDILFMGNIDHKEGRKADKFTPEELKAIKRFVGEGGGLFLTIGDGGDKDIPMKDGSVRVLYNVTGVRRFWNGKIVETSSNFHVKKHNLSITEFYAHPIVEGITELILPNTTFFTLTDDANDIIRTSDKAKFEYYDDDEVVDIGSVPICAASKFHRGRTVTVGSANFLLDNEYGIDAGDNLHFLENIIKWLMFEI
ncbi:MAG: hypothetical protein R6U96_14005 [Promethearchaeia archaeon]